MISVPAYRAPPPRPVRSTTCCSNGRPKRASLRTDVSVVEQLGRAGDEGLCARPRGVAVRRLEAGRRAGSGDGDVDRGRKTQRL